MSLTNSPYWFGGGVDSFYPTQINDSLRFEDGSSPRLSLDPIGSPTDAKKATISFWLKRGNLGSTQFIFTGEQSNIYYDLLWFDTSDKFNVTGQENAVSEGYITTAVFRDTSAFYHFVVELDSTLSTAADRVKIYVNGVLQDKSVRSGYTAYNQNHEFYFNKSGNSQNIGRSENYGSGFDGYLSDIHFIDGQALDPTSFGEAKDGTWIPKSYSGSYGTNGFHLDFNGNSNDTSGNSNNFTATNISAHDYVPDSPTNNFATFNPLEKHSASVLSEGNLVSTSSNANDWECVGSTMHVSSGKWYCEVVLTGASGTFDLIIGVARSQSFEFVAGNTFYTPASNFGYYASVGDVYSGGALSGDFNVTYTNGDVIGIAIDMDNLAVYFAKNGTYINSGDPTSGASKTGLSGALLAGASYQVAVGAYQNNVTFTANFGQDSTFAGATTAGGNSDANGRGDFKYAPPSGYLALCTANLTEPTIIDGSDYFNTVLYTGNGATGQTITTGLSPDFVWAKSRVSAYDHGLQDTVRGATKDLNSNDTQPEETRASSITSFTSTGFVLGGNDVIYNESGGSHVAWNWKAGTAFSNSAGSNGATIASSGSVNTDAGFSIVSYTGSGSNGTVLHSLSSAPEIIFFKKRNVTTSWMVYSKTIGNNRFLYLDLPNGQTGTDSTYFNNLDPTSSVINLGTYHRNNTINEPYIAYAFHSVDGYSKVNSYIGNGVADGPFVYTGFRPAFVVTKRSDGTSWWGISDSKRSPYNEVANTLAANEGYSESYLTSDMNVDFLSNGFKIRDTSSYYNASGIIYIYLAFAETPQKYSNAR